MENEAVRIIVLAMAWITYGAIHSLLAANAMRQRLTKRWPNLAPAYRLLYNGLSILLLAPPLALLYGYPGTAVIAWPESIRWLLDGLALLALAGFFWSLKFYDSEEFLGIQQWRSKTTKPVTPEFVISPLHRYVRHPWYSFGLVLIWTRDMDSMMFTTALILTAYFAIGSRLEERKLEQLHGDPYRRYRQKVPGLIPRPWRYLGKEEARQLLSS